jgi:hypothetical protein
MVAAGMRELDFVPVVADGGSGAAAWLDDNVISSGMCTREIVGHLRDLYDSPPSSTPTRLRRSRGDRHDSRIRVVRRDTPASLGDQRERPHYSTVAGADLFARTTRRIPNFIVDTR